MEVSFASTKVRSIAATLILVWFVSTSLIFAAQGPALEEVCLKMDNLVDEMLGLQISQCSPSLSKRAGKYSFFFGAKRPVLTDPSDRRVWLLAIVGVAGRAMTDTQDFPGLKGVDVDEVLTFDPEFAKQRRVLALPAPVVKRIRNDLLGGTINVDRAYDQIKAALAERSLN